MACCTGAWPQSETADLDCHKKRRGQAQKLLSIVKERVEKVRSDTEHDVLEYCQLIWPQHEHDEGSVDSDSNFKVCHGMVTVHFYSRVHYSILWHD